MPIAVHRFADHEAASAALADRLIAYVREHPKAVLALPSGNTPKAAYARIADATRSGQVSFEHVTIFALDEYVGFDRQDAGSFAAFFEQHVFGPFAVPRAQAHVLNGKAPDPAAEAQRYEQRIEAAGGLDLTLLGLGKNGHIAFNEPDATLSAHAHVVPLQPPACAVAPCGITLGVGTLLSAEHVWLIATGADKAAPVERMLNGRIDTQCPASLLQVHPRAEVLVDEAAYSRIR